MSFPERQSICSFARNAWSSPLENFLFIAPPFGTFLSPVSRDARIGLSPPGLTRAILDLPFASHFFAVAQQLPRFELPL